MGRLDIVYPFTPQKRFIPFLTVGGGVISSDNGEDQNTSGMASYGGGFKVKLFESLLFRTEVRHNLIYRDEFHNNFEISAGVTIALAMREPKKPEPVRDSDGDGVPDSVDACPGTAKGIKVDKQGCPPDEDNDGVPDHRDRCPGTPKGTPVDEVGCELIPQLVIPEQMEGAADPVPVQKEEPVVTAAIPSTAESTTAPLTDTPVSTPLVAEVPIIAPIVQAPAKLTAAERAAAEEAAAKLSAAERAAAEPAATERTAASQTATETTAVKADQQQVVLETVYFEYDSFLLSKDARRALARTAEVITKKLTATVRLEGHCDVRGSDEYNLALGEKRARAVMKYLVSRGVPAERLTVSSYGKERPAVAGNTEQVWARNRRVEFVIVK
jgi:peptidoglycan-associated lipoprotein